MATMPHASGSGQPYQKPTVESESEEEENDDDDPIVKRLPIYYTPHYLNSLTLLQYPDRPPRPHTQHPLLPPSLRPGADPAPKPERSQINARYKPQTGHLELEVPIEMHPDRWNPDTAEKFGEGLVDDQAEEGKGKKKKKSAAAAEKEAEKEGDKEPKRLDRMVYSSLSVPDVTNYLIGVVKDDALHLSPVTQTYQMRPSLNYLDNRVTIARRKKREAEKDKDAEDDEADLSDADIKKAEAKAVQVSIKQSADLSGGGAFGKSGAAGGGGNGRAGAGLFDPLRAMEGEAWIPLKHYHAETPEATAAFDGMFASEESLGVQLTSTTKPKQYLESS